MISKSKNEIPSAGEDLTSSALNEESYKLLADISPDGMMVSTDGIVVYANPVAAKIWEARDAQEVIETKAVDLVHPDYLGLSENRHAETQVGNSNLPVAQFKIITFRGNEKFCGIHGRRNYY